MEGKKIRREYKPLMLDNSPIKGYGKIDFEVSGDGMVLIKSKDNRERCPNGKVCKAVGNICSVYGCGG